MQTMNQQLINLMEAFPNEIELTGEFKEIILRALSSVNSLIIDNQTLTHSYLIACTALFTGWLSDSVSQIGCFSASLGANNQIFKEMRELIDKIPPLAKSIAYYGYGYEQNSWEVAFNGFSSETRAFGVSGVKIKSFLLSDARNLHGYRAEMVFVDELQSIPDKLFDTAIRPMLATSSPKLEMKVLRDIKELDNTSFDDETKSRLSDEIRKIHQESLPPNRLIMFANTRHLPDDSYLHTIYQSYVDNKGCYATKLG
jgi:hypothetical protein